MQYQLDLLKEIQDRLYLPLNNFKSACQYWVNIKYDNKLKTYQQFVSRMGPNSQIRLFCMEHDDFLICIKLGLKQGLNIITI